MQGLPHSTPRNRKCVIFHLAREQDLCECGIRCLLILGGHLLRVSRYAGGVSGWRVSGQELCDAVDRVFGDVGQDISEIAFRVNAVEPDCTEQRVDSCGAFSTAVRSGEEIVLPFCEISSLTQRGRAPDGRKHITSVRNPISETIRLPRIESVPTLTRTQASYRISEAALCV